MHGCWVKMQCLHTVNIAVSLDGDTMGLGSGGCVGGPAMLSEHMLSGSGDNMVGLSVRVALVGEADAVPPYGQSGSWSMQGVGVTYALNLWAY